MNSTIIIIVMESQAPLQEQRTFGTMIRKIMVKEPLFISFILSVN